MWRPILIFIGVTLIVGFILGFRLGNLTPGVSNAEVNYVNSISSGKEIIKHPVYIIHKIPVYILFKLGAKNIQDYRTVSALFAGLAVVSLFFVLREWYTNRIAVLGSLLFLTSAWTLHTARLATPEASYLLLVPLLWAFVWLYFTTFLKSALLVVSFLCSLCFYIPGFGLLLIGAAIWKHKIFWKELKKVPLWFRLICGAIVITGLVPLLWASSASPTDLLLTMGLPDKFPMISHVFNNLTHIPTNLFIYGPADPVRWLGKIPILDVFSTTMLIFGLYSIRYHLIQTKIQILLYSSLVSAVLISLGGLVTITVIMPAIYILIAGGVAFILQQWRTVFPKNPIANTFATSMISAIVLLVSFYHINHYFIAWPQTPATKAAFRYTLVK